MARLTRRPEFMLPPSGQSTMRAMAIDHFGGKEELRLHDLPIPEPQADEVLIRVKAAGVGPWDKAMCEGEFNLKQPFPLVLGMEAAGLIERRGSRVRRFAPGDRVFSYFYPQHSLGAYAEHVAVPARWVAPMPASLSFTEAAAVPVGAITAHQALFDDLGLRRREWVLINGASGGVGSFAVQLAARAGAFVIAVASSRNHRYLRHLGAHAVVDYDEEELARGVRRAHQPGVDVVLDCVGEETSRASMEVVRDGGRVGVLVGKAPAAERDILVTPIQSRPDGARLARIARMLDAGELKVQVQQTFPLSRAPDALGQVEQHHVRGKLVLRV